MTIPAAPSISRTALTNFATLSPAQKKAIERLEELEKTVVTMTWKYADRATMFIEIAQRVEQPGLIQQGTAGLCGPASTLFDLASRDPLAYVNFTMAMYFLGHAHLGKREVTAAANLLDAEIPSGVPQGDWIPMSAIRCSENEFFEYTSNTQMALGITMPREIVSWLKSLGYTQVINQTQLLNIRSTRWATAADASRLYREGYRVILFVNSDGSEVVRSSRKTLLPNHWVVLTSEILLTEQRVSFTVFSWGDGKYSVPLPTSTGTPGVLPLDRFLKNFHGYIAARF